MSLQGMCQVRRITPLTVALNGKCLMALGFQNALARRGRALSIVGAGWQGLLAVCFGYCVDNVSTQYPSAQTRFAQTVCKLAQGQPQALRGA